MRTILLLLSLAATTATAADAAAAQVGPKKALRATVKTAHAIKTAHRASTCGPVVVREPARRGPVVISTPRRVVAGPVYRTQPVCAQPVAATPVYADPVHSCGSASNGFIVDDCDLGHDQGAFYDDDFDWRLRVTIRHGGCGYRGRYLVNRRGATHLRCGGCGHRFVYRRCY